MSALSKIQLATNKAFVRYDNDDVDDAGIHVSLLPEAEIPLNHFRQDNDDIFLVPETRSTLAQYEETADDNDGIGPLVKRGLGRCIHRCLKGPGRMSFIQCKSMCHR